MSIDEMFKKYPDNLIGFRTNSGNKVIDFWFDKMWKIPQDLISSDIEIKQVKEEGDSVYYYVYSPKLSFIDLYNLVANFIEYNLDIEKRKILFNEKVNELKRLFLEKQFDELKNIEFNIVHSLTEPVSELEPINKDK